MLREELASKEEIFPNSSCTELGKGASIELNQRHKAVCPKRSKNMENIDQVLTSVGYKASNEWNDFLDRIKQDHVADTAEQRSPEEWAVFLRS